MMIEEQAMTAHLNEVIDCLQEQERSLRSKKPPENISLLYENTKSLLDQFQDHFSRCRKYNQAKIHRKYEIIITDLAEENKNLRAKLKLQLESRPSSEKYVSDLIDKMIVLRNHNEKLAKDNKNLKNCVEKLETKYDPVRKSTPPEEEENPEKKELLKKEWEKVLIRETVDRFVALKREEKAIKHIKQVSNFERFLQFNQSKLDRWYLLDLFERVEKWTDNLKDIRFLDKTKIKMHLEKSVSKVMEPINSPPKAATAFNQVPNNAFNTLQRTATNKSVLEGSLSRVEPSPNKEFNQTKRGNIRLRALHQSERRIDPTTVF